MSLCICDGPPHPYDPSWCRGGRSADPPHHVIDPLAAFLEQQRLYNQRNAPWSEPGSR